MQLETALLLLGALSGAFVNGLTGFGTGLTALVFWLHAVPPVVAAPLVCACSVVAQLQSLPGIWHAIDFRRLAPFVIGGCLGGAPRRRGRSGVSRCAHHVPAAGLSACRSAHGYFRGSRCRASSSASAFCSSSIAA